jgi:hypothetical protein
VEEHLPGKCKALSSVPSTEKKKKKKEETLLYPRILSNKYKG